MTDRERLVELLKNSKLCSYPFGDQYSDETIGKVADHLLANGVIVPPCKVGDTLHLVQVDFTGNYFTTSVVVGSKITMLSILRAYEEKTVVYMSTDKEETEKALAERQGNRCEQ